MSLPVIFHELAEGELNEAAQYYESEVSGLGLAFLEEVERSMEQIRNHPEAAQCILMMVRRKLLRRFPYSIIYSVVDDTVRILAIANQKRRPFYWSGRALVAVKLGERAKRGGRKKFERALGKVRNVKPEERDRF